MSRHKSVLILSMISEIYFGFHEMVSDSRGLQICTKFGQTDKRSCFAGELPREAKFSPELSTGIVDRFTLEIGCGSVQREGESGHG